MDYSATNASTDHYTTDDYARSKSSLTNDDFSIVSEESKFSRKNRKPSDSTWSTPWTSADCSTTDASTNYYARSKSSLEDDESYIVFEESEVAESRNPSDKTLDRILNGSYSKSEANVKKKKVRTYNLKNIT